MRIPLWQPEVHSYREMEALGGGEVHTDFSSPESTLQQRPPLPLWGPPQALAEGNSSRRRRECREKRRKLLRRKWWQCPFKSGRSIAVLMWPENLDQKKARFESILIKSVGRQSFAKVLVRSKRRPSLSKQRLS